MENALNPALNYEVLMNHIPTDMVVLDTDFRYRYVSPLTVKNEELRKWLIGKDDFEFCTYRNLSLEIAENRVRHLKQVFDSGRSVKFTELSTRDGEQKYVERIYIPVFTEGTTEVSHILGYSVDITEQRRLEISNQILFQKILDRESHKVSGSLSRIKGLFDLLKVEQDSEQVLVYQHLINQQIDEMTENVKEVTQILYSSLARQS